MRIWFKIWDKTHLINDYTYEDYSNDTRTHKIFAGLEEACVQFNLARPIWLDATVSDLKRFKKARFNQDNFMEQIDFSYMEIDIIEED